MHQKDTREKEQNFAPVQNPWSWVVRVETECNVVAGITSRDDITNDWINVVVTRIASAPNDIKCLLSYYEPWELNSRLGLTPCKWKGCYIRKLSTNTISNVEP
jgi:hypothetical protein